MILLIIFRLPVPSLLLQRGKTTLSAGCYIIVMRPKSDVLGTNLSAISIGYWRTKSASFCAILEC